MGGLYSTTYFYGSSFDIFHRDMHAGSVQLSTTRVSMFETMRKAYRSTRLGFVGRCFVTVQYMAHSVSGSYRAVRLHFQDENHSFRDELETRACGSHSLDLDAEDDSTKNALFMRFFVTARCVHVSYSPLRPR